jgi:hypothetical protein
MAIPRSKIVFSLLPFFFCLVLFITSLHVDDPLDKSICPLTKVKNKLSNSSKAGVNIDFSSAVDQPRFIEIMSAPPEKNVDYRLPPRTSVSTLRLSNRAPPVRT